MWDRGVKVSARSVPLPAELLRRRCRPLLPVRIALTLWAQISWLPSSDTPQRGSDICLMVALSSWPVTGSRDSHWKSLNTEEALEGWFYRRLFKKKLNGKWGSATNSSLWSRLISQLYCLFSNYLSCLTNKGQEVLNHLKDICYHSGLSSHSGLYI